MPDTDKPRALKLPSMTVPSAKLEDLGRPEASRSRSGQAAQVAEEVKGEMLRRAATEEFEEGSELNTRGTVYVAAEAAYRRAIDDAAECVDLAVTEHYSAGKHEAGYALRLVWNRIRALPDQE